MEFAIAEVQGSIEEAIWEMNTFVHLPGIVSTGLGSIEGRHHWAM